MTDLRDADSTDGAVTMINVIEIPADQVDAFLTGWHERAHIMSTLPGFRDYQLHRALLGDSRFQLVNIARWDSLEAFQAAVANSDFLTRMRELEADPRFDVAGNPGLYRVVDHDQRES
jgi:heme-degrading monooxygenase HmoA